MVDILYKEANAEELILVGKDFFDRDVYLEIDTHASWLDMQKSAKNDGVILHIVSGFRSYAYQQAIIDRKLDKGISLEDIKKVNATPGMSEHHTGRAIDFTTENEAEVLTESFENTNAFKWLTANAHNFGFTMSFPRDNDLGFIYEPWHWCYQK